MSKESAEFYCHLINTTGTSCNKNRSRTKPSKIKNSSRGFYSRKYGSQCTKNHFILLIQTQIKPVIFNIKQQNLYHHMQNFIRHHIIFAVYSVFPRMEPFNEISASVRKQNFSVSHILMLNSLFSDWWVF